MTSAKRWSSRECICCGKQGCASITELSEWRRASSWSPVLIGSDHLTFWSFWKNPFYHLSSIMSVLVSPSGIHFQSLFCLNIFCLSSFSQTLEQCRLRKALKLWYQKCLVPKTIEQSPKHSHRAVYEEPLAMLFSEDLSTSSGFDSSAPATLASQSSLEKVRRSWYIQTALGY